MDQRKTLLAVLLLGIGQITTVCSQSYPVSTHSRDFGVCVSLSYTNILHIGGVVCRNNNGRTTICLEAGVGTSTSGGSARLGRGSAHHRQGHQLTGFADVQDKHLGHLSIEGGWVDGEFKGNVKVNSHGVKAIGSGSYSDKDGLQGKADYQLASMGSYEEASLKVGLRYCYTV